MNIVHKVMAATQRNPMADSPGTDRPRSPSRVKPRRPWDANWVPQIISGLFYLFSADCRRATAGRSETRGRVRVLPVNDLEDVKGSRPGRGASFRLYRLSGVVELRGSGTIRSIVKTVKAVPESPLTKLYKEAAGVSSFRPLIHDLAEVVRSVVP